MSEITKHKAHSRIRRGGSVLHVTEDVQYTNVYWK